MKDESSTKSQLYTRKSLIADRDSCRRIIEYEGGLINSRISWLVAGQSFLLGTYALLLNSPNMFINQPSSSISISSVGSTYDAVKMLDAVVQMRFWFCFVGTTLALVTSIAVWAGFRAIIRRNEEFTQGIFREVSAEIRWRVAPPLAGRDRRIWGMGTTIIGPMFMIVWIGMLIGKWYPTWQLAVVGALILVTIWWASAYKLRPVEEMPPGQWIHACINRLRRSTVLIAGQGALGSRVKDRLETFGHTVLFVDSRQKDLLLQDEFREPMQDSRKSIPRASACLIFVQGNDEVKQLLDGLWQKGLQKSCVLINHSTISVKAAKSIANKAHRHHYDYLEMPVSGGVEAAERGKLSGFYCGKDSIYLKVVRILKCYCDAEKCIRFSCFGEPAAYKLVNQVGIAGALHAVLESLAAAKSLKLNLHDALRVLQSGAADSWSMRFHGQQIIDKNFRSGISRQNFLKDLKYVQDEISIVQHLRGVQDIASLLNSSIARSAEKTYTSPYIYEEFMSRLEAVHATAVSPGEQTTSR